MKKILSIMLALALAICLSACASNNGDDTSSKAPDTSDVSNNVDEGAKTDSTKKSKKDKKEDADKTTAAEETKSANPSDQTTGVRKDADVDKEIVPEIPTVLNTMEYTLYQNIFYNDQAADYVDKDVEKEGVFTTIIDKYNDVTRYYVWGYNDNTKCCDWQWEIKLDKGQEKSLPSDGSSVVVKGKFVQDDNALDKYWITSPSIETKETYKGPDCDLNLTTMGATLERVQLVNIQQFKEDFEGQSIYLYGRVQGNATLQHPYYDGMWNQDFSTKDETPAIGTCCILNGTLENGIVSNAHISATNNY